MRYAIRIGFLVGLATLTRPTDVLSFLIPLFWGIDSVTLTAFRNRIRLFRQQIPKMTLALVMAMAVYSIQLFYWKYVSGHWFVYSYGGQGFNFLHPYFIEYTFSYKSGWLMYCPTMVLAFIGIPFFFKNGRNKLAILSFFFLNYYVVCTWDIWSYGGRAMIQSFPVLFFPIATLTEFIFAQRWLIYLYSTLVAFFVYFNTWTMVQYHGGGLYDVDNMTRNYYWRVVGRWHVPEETIFLRDETELFEGVMKNKRVVYSNDFSELTDTQRHNDSASKHSYLLLTKDRQNSKVYKFGFSGPAQWLRIEADFRSENKTDDDWKMAQFIVRLMKDNVEKELKLNVLRVNRSLRDGKTKRLFIDVRLPKEHFDFVEIIFWNGGSDQDLYVSNLKAWQFDE
ncbi:MAG: hypothetical protein IAE95_08915 [Chitinophagaceae bacterium]|nr:hypothetical protein [Chitinophagaceae bacterium]